MLKTILTALVSLFLVSNSSDKTIRQQQGPKNETGTLEKMVVANGNVAMELDLDRLNGNKSQSRFSRLNFAVAPDQFFTVLVFNGDLRGPELGSMALVPQNSAALPAALNASLDKLVIERIDWTEAFELVVRDSKTGVVFFNIEGNVYDYDAKTQSLSIRDGRLLVSKEFAAKLGRPSQEGSVVGAISVTATMRAIEITQVVNGEARSSVMPAAGTVPGPDVIVGDLSGLQQFGSSSGGQVGLAVATDSCNAGVVPLNWFALPSNDHPVIPQNLYRMSADTTRFEQVGQSNVKHAFTALQQNLCGFGCQSSGTGTLLGSGCSDPYSASLNSGGASNGLGSRAWINPYTGAYPGGSGSAGPNGHTGHSHTGPSHRILVEMADLNTTLNPGATYYAEAQYVTPHEYAWCVAHPGECNMGNNASYRQYTVTGTTSFSFATNGSTTQRMKPAITAWTGANVKDFEPDPGNDGLAYIGYKVTNPSPGVWHYEYALYNQNLDRAIQSFSVPLGIGTVSNVGFHAPPQHPGWTNDGTVGNTGYSSAPWTTTQTATDLTWSSETLVQNPNANAIRWGTLYNYRFDSNRPPQTTSATVGFLKTGAPIQVTVQAPDQGPGISISDVVLTEGNSGTKLATFNVSLAEASTDTVTVQYATANGTATAGTDYVAASGPVTFVPSDVAETVSITINGDTLEEFNETFFVNLSTATNGTIADAQGAGTITNDEAPLAALPSGFAETQISGLSNPTAIAVHPDGRVFVCQQGGALRVIKNGALLPTPFTTITVDSFFERGLLGIAFDPNYASNRFIYVYYTATSPTTHNRVSRFTADIANEDVAVAGSEVAILDLETLSAGNHNGGAIHFGPDGKLYVAVGENAVPSNSQSLGNRLGKMLRINADGTIPPDNPTTFSGIAGSPTGLNQAIWAVGLRNPFTFSFQPGTGRLHINDVGQSAWEEVNLGAAGANYGWGAGCEGTCGVAGMTNPIYQYANDGSTCAIAGGAFYNPTVPTFPAEYLGKYFFADLCGGWIKSINPLSPPATGTAPNFATGISSPVDIQVANDGSLYYLARGSSSVFRVQYFGNSTLTINDVSVTEGNAGTATATFTVTLLPASNQTLTVQYATVDGSAVSTGGSPDFTAVPLTSLVFLPTETTKQVTVSVNGDSIFEPNETFTVHLSNPSGATIADADGTATITNDDLQPTISINDVTLSEGNAGTTDYDFTVSLSNASSQQITVNAATANNTATTADGDYTGVAGTLLTFPANTTTQHFHVFVNGDTKFEPNESFNVNLSGATNATIADNQGVGTLTNEDTQPTISISDVTHNEGNAGTTDYDFTVSLSNPSSQTITVNAISADNTATTADSDYTSVASTLLTFPANTTTQHFHVFVNGDAKFEPNESFNVNLSGATNATIADNHGVGTITNDDTQPTISISDVTHNEGQAGTTDYDFIVTLSSVSSETITVNASTANNTATTADSDYTGVPGTLLTFAANTTTQHFHVSVNGDTKFEGNESFFVNLSGATNATIADNQGAGTITNDDTQPAIAINDVSVNEGNGVTSSAGFTVSLTNASSQTVTVNYATANNTAIAGSDYVAASGTLTFMPGQTSQPINVTVNGDLMNEESPLTFNVNLSTPTNATIADGLGVGTITDDDDPILETEPSSQRAVALDAVMFVRDPFAVTNPHYYGTDHRTRVMLFVRNLDLTPAPVVTAHAVDAQLMNYDLTVEHVGTLPTFLGFTQVVVRLPDGIVNAGDLQVTITVRGRTSNTVLVGVTP